MPDTEGFSRGAGFTPPPGCRGGQPISPLPRGTKLQATDNALSCPWESEGGKNLPSENGRPMLLAPRYAGPWIYLTLLVPSALTRAAFTFLTSTCWLVKVISSSLRPPLAPLMRMDETCALVSRMVW